jgi:hypothetical protein
VKIGYSLAEHAQSNNWYSSMRDNHFGAPRAFFRVFPLFPLSPIPLSLLRSLSNVLCPLSHVFVICLPSYVPSSLFLVLCPLCHVSVPCLPSAVPNLTSLILVPHPLSPVSRLCSLYPILYPLSHGSAPCLPSSVPCLT